MIVRITLLFSLLICSCKPAKKIEYIEGLVNCHSKTSNKPWEVTHDCLIGVQMPIFKATTIEGKTIDADYFKGKVTVLNFWFQSCPPCVAEIPGFNEVVKKFDKKKVNFLAIGRDSKREIIDFLEENQWNFDHVPDGKDLIYKTFDMPWGFPTTFLVDKNSKIVMTFSGGKDDERAIQEIQDKLVPMIEKELKKRG